MASLEINPAETTTALNGTVDAGRHMEEAATEAQAGSTVHHQASCVGKAAAAFVSMDEAMSSPDWVPLDEDDPVRGRPEEFQRPDDFPHATLDDAYRESTGKERPR